MQTHLTLCNDSVQDVHQLVWAHFHILHEKYGISLKNMKKPAETQLYGLAK